MHTLFKVVQKREVLVCLYKKRGDSHVNPRPTHMKARINVAHTSFCAVSVWGFTVYIVRSKSACTAANCEKWRIDLHFHASACTSSSAWVTPVLLFGWVQMDSELAKESIRERCACVVSGKATRVFLAQHVRALAH